MMPKFYALFLITLFTCIPALSAAGESVRPHYETPAIQLPILWRACNSGADCILLYYGCNSVTAVRSNFKISAEKIFATGNINVALTCAPTDTHDVVASCLHGTCTATPFLY